jgi:4-hydroxybenzoate polyprenyltransferase
MRANRIWHAIASVRAQDWWSYKIPPLLTTAYAGYVAFDPKSIATLAVSGGALVCICLVAVYGYVLNVITDIEEDQRAGRRNRMAGVSWPKRLGFVLLSPIACFTLAWSIGVDRTTLVLLGINFLLPTLYSVPPVRLKERGVWGVLADACGVHAVPTATIARVAVSDVHGADAMVMSFVTAAVACALFAGLRGIIIHQAADRDVDRLAGVVTFVGTIGIERSRQLVLRWLLPCEVVSLGIYLMVVLPHAPVAMLFVVLFGLAEGMKIYRGWKLPMFEPADEGKEPYIPLLNNEFYEVWLPFSLVLQLVVYEPILMVVALLQTFLFYPNLRIRVGALAPLFKRAPHSAPRTLAGR